MSEPPASDGRTPAITLKQFYASPEAAGLKTVALEKISDALPVKDQIALRDARVRRDIAYGILGLFGVVNIVTLLFVYLLFRADQSDLTGKIVMAGDRIVNAHVIMTLLGATTVQLGTVMVIMARYVFRPAVDGEGE